MNIKTRIRGIDYYLEALSPEAVKKNTDKAMNILMDMGVKRADWGFNTLRGMGRLFTETGSAYIGDVDAKITSKKSENGFKITATGDSVLFIEFGAGIKYGHGHPQESEFGMGAGTYPDGKGHWDDPNGWYLPVEKAGKRGVKSKGNIPHMPMYYTGLKIKRNAGKVFRSVFITGRGGESVDV